MERRCLLSNLRSDQVFNRNIKLETAPTVKLPYTYVKCCTTFVRNFKLHLGTGKWEDVLSSHGHKDAQSFPRVKDTQRRHFCWRLALKTATSPSRWPSEVPAHPVRTKPNCKTHTWTTNIYFLDIQQGTHSTVFYHENKYASERPLGFCTIIGPITKVSNASN